LEGHKAGFTLEDFCAIEMVPYADITKVALAMEELQVEPVVNGLVAMVMVAIQ
jgi:hypothetical protein